LQRLLFPLSAALEMLHAPINNIISQFYEFFHTELKKADFLRSRSV